MLQLKVRKGQLATVLLCSIFLTSILLGYGLVHHQANPLNSSSTGGTLPDLTGWGAVKLAEVETTVNGVNDFEAHLQLLQKMGYNSVRVEWQSPCIADEGGGAYSNADFHTAAMLAKKYNIWLVMDWLSGTDVGTSCWLSNWQGIIQYADSNINYTQIIWEPENEPMSSVGITQLTIGYQAFLNMARQQGDTRWVVVSNLCIQSCESNPSPGGWPTINDTAQHVLMDWHSYMYYPYWSSQSTGWTNATADAAAQIDYQFTLSALQVCSWCRLINTEIGADPIGGCPPDATPSGACGDTCDGYTTVTVHFVQDLIKLFDSANIGWMGWGIGSWLTNDCGSNTFEGNLSGQISYGSLQQPLGWGLQLGPQTILPDYQITANPTTISVVQGTSGTSLITLASLNSFTGNMTVSTTTSDNSITATANPSSLTLPVNGQATTTLTIATTTGTPTGTQTITVTASSGTLSHSTTISLTVNPPPPAPDFSISSNQITLRIVQGSTTAPTITLTSVSGFTGTLNLTTTISTTSATATLNPNTLTLSSGGSGKTTLTISTMSSTPAGTYIASVTAASGRLTHNVTISVTVAPPPDFAIFSSPSMLTIPQGSSGYATLTFTSLNDLIGSLSLTATLSTNSFVVTLNPASFSLPPGGQTSTALTLSPTGTASPGTYTVSVTATGPGLSHSVTIAITVTAVAVQPIQTIISWSPTAPATGEIVVFTASATNGQQPYTFNWLFGDGYTTTGSNVIHAYSTSGNYTVTLLVVDTSGLTASSQQLLTIGTTSASLLLSVPGSEKASFGSMLTFSVTASNPQSTGAISITSTNIPPQASFTSASGNPVTGKFSWTPTTATKPGPYNITFHAAQSGSSYTASKTVTVLLAATTPTVPCIFCTSTLWQTISLGMIGATIGLVAIGSVTFLRSHRNRHEKMPGIPLPVPIPSPRVAVTPIYGKLETPFGISKHESSSIRVPRGVLDSAKTLPRKTRRRVRTSD